MGDARRDDRDRQHHRDQEVDGSRADEHEDEVELDTAHADVQRRLHARPTQAKGMVVTHEGEHAYEGKGDQDALWTKFEAYLDAHDVSGWPLALVRDMDAEHRYMVAVRLADVARVVTGGDLLVIAELIHVLPGAAVTAALACDTKPTRAQLRAYLGGLEPGDLALELGDRAIVNQLRAAYPGSPVSIVPQIQGVLGDPVLASWYLGDTPSEQIAMTMVRSESPAAMAGQLNTLGRGGWMWAFHVDPALTAIGATAVEIYAKASNQADVRTFLQAKFDDREGTITSIGSVETELQGELKKRHVDADEVIEDLAVIEGLGADQLTKPDRRRKFLAGAGARQIDQATLLLNLPLAERLRWLLDGGQVTLDELRDVIAGWPDEDRNVVVDAKVIAKLLRRFPGARPAELFGRVPESLYGTGGHDPVIRRWIVDGGQPHEILAFLTIFPGHTAERCLWLGSAGGGWGWLDRVGGGVNDTALRAVALNCPDPEVVKRIHAELLGDYREEASDIATPTPTSARAFEDPNRGMERAIDLGEKSRELADRAGELTPQDVAELRRDPVRLGQLLANTQGASLVRVLYLVEPPMATLFARKGLVAVGETPGAIDVTLLSGWLRARPGEDVVAGLTDPDAFAVVRQLFPVAPLEVFPQLRVPSVLARVVEGDSERLEWIIKHSEPMSALHAIGALGVAQATVSALEEDGHLVEWLPSGALLSPRDRGYLYSLYNIAEGRLKKRIAAQIGASESKHDESTVDERAVGDDRKERNGQTLAVALEAILGDSDIHAEDLITLCRERAGEAEEMIQHNPDLVFRALRAAKVSPQVLFAAAPLETFFVDEKLAELTFDSVPGFVILRASATSGRLRGALVRGLEANEGTYAAWLRRLPTGSGLTPEEESELERLAAAVTSDGVTRELFKRRFGSPVSDDFERREVMRLWHVMARLPSAHREQEAVAAFHEIPKEGRPLDGEFDPGSGAVSMKDGLVDRADDNPLYNRAGPTSQMTRAQAMAAFQLTEDQLDQWVADKRIIRTGDVYEMAPAPQPDRFTGTALHEIGHAVDDRLGNQTELVFGLAGWKQYGEADFDAWATDLGGWDQVTPADQPKIKEAWMVWINSSNAAGRPGVPLHELVPFDHPAIHVDYAGVGIVDLGRGREGSSSSPFVANGRAYIMNGLYQMMYSLPLRSVHSAPSAYALTAPGEYFAECYMAYYLTSDGTPNTAANKGELVAPWIKRWMDTNVDRMSFNPNPRRDD